MIEAGMNVARLNFSHGDHETHARTLQRVREAAAKCRTNVAIMLDTKGPEIRTGFFEAGGSIDLVAGQELMITTDYEFKGDSTCFACSYKDLPNSVKVGSTILVADGSLVLKVTQLFEDRVKTEVQNDATIGERKNMNLPGVVVNLPVITEKDRRDLTEFGVRHHVDMIAASFVRKGSDIGEIRECLGDAARAIKIIAKIENQEGLENFDAILEESDGIMVARGDLGMEIPSEKVFMAQKRMIRQCNLYGKPVITATQMLESMVKNPRPTRAECTDVANAVLDGSDCVMLSGETAGGAHPLAAVRIMAGICREAESITSYRQLYGAIRASTLDEIPHAMSVTETVASSAVKTVEDLDAAAVLVCSETGNSARLVAKYRPDVPILVLTATEWVSRQAEGLLRGVQAITIGSMIGTDGILLRAIEMCRDKGWVKSGDHVVAVHGMLEGRPGSTNMMKVLTVP